MKKIVSLLISACVLQGCFSEHGPEGNDQPLHDYRTFEATVELPSSLSPAVSKVILNGKTSCWEEGDCITVFEDSPTPLKYCLSGMSPDGKNGVFATSSELPEQGAFGGTNIAVSPYFPSCSCSLSGTGYTIGNFIFPALQHYRKASFDISSVPMVAYSGDRNLYFKNAAGLLKIQIAGEGRIRNIRLEGNSGEQLAGPAVLNVEGGEISSEWVKGGSQASCSIDLDCSGNGGVLLNSDVPVSFIIGMAPLTFSNGFSLTVTDMDGNAMRMVTNKPVTVVRSHISSMPVSNFIPDTRKKGQVPVRERVDIQSTTAPSGSVIDGAWVAVGLKGRDYAVQLDYDKLYRGLHSYRFELRGNEDNTLGSYSGGKKGRSEMSWCYATDRDFNDRKTYADASILKTVYYHGKGYCPQASRMKYTFAIQVSSSLPDNVSGIFAQWHGMPSRTLTRNPDGILRELTDAEFIQLSQTMIIDKDKGYEILPNGKKGAENGWRFEQGGYPPMSFAFGKGYFYIQANSDRSWLTDKSIRCNINPETAAVGAYSYAPETGPQTDLKRSTLAYKMPMKDFPRDCWVTFDIEVDWTHYGREAETAEGGCLDVVMSYEQDGKTVSDHIVDNMAVLIGRNDEKGYYFKFGIYRADGSTVPVFYNLAGYHEEMAG